MNVASTVDFEIRSGGELDGYYRSSHVWTRELDRIDVDTVNSAVVCQAWDEDGFEIGVLATDSDGLILVVSIEPEYRRLGIATRMYRELVAAGYQPQHDWENMRPEGAAWAASLGAA